MSLRRPIRAVQSASIPSLALWLAGAVGAAGCEDPQCASGRVGELDVHGANATQRLRGVDFVGAAQEVAVATGLRHHPPTPVVEVPAQHQVRNPGGAMRTRVVPETPTPVPEVGVTGGATPAVTTVPPPQRPATPRRPHRAPPPAPPTTTYERHMLGDVVSVGPAPVTTRQG